MSSEPPKPGAIPGWGQSQPDPPPAAPSPAPVQPAPGQGAIPGWGQTGPDQPSPPPTEPAPAGAPSSVPATPPATPPAPGPTATPGWGQAPPPSSPPAAAQPAWGGPPGSAGPGDQPPGGWNPQPAATSGSSGCLKLILILLIVGAIGFFLLIAGLILLGNQIASTIGVNSDGTGGSTCTLIDSGALHDTLGGDAEAFELTGFYDVTIGIVLDNRVLPDAEDCWITAGNSTPVGRIAKYTGGDAAARFQQERQNAAPTSQDQGGGLSLEGSGYFAGDVSGLGDEAFCTGVSPAIQAGVLVRKGDTLVYVSLSGPSDGSTPDFGTTPDGVITAPAICAQAQELARRMLP